MHLNMDTHAEYTTTLEQQKKKNIYNNKSTYCDKAILKNTNFINKDL